MAPDNLVTGKFGTSTILHQDNLAPQFIDIYWTFIANSNYTLPNLEYYDSTIPVTRVSDVMGGRLTNFLLPPLLSCLYYSCGNLNFHMDSTRLFWPTIGMSVSDSLCPWPLRAKGEFYPILSQITTMNHDDDIFSPL